MSERINLAKNKRVNALGLNVSAVTDGITDANVHWDGGPAPAGVTVDLDGYYKISEVVLTTYYGDERSYLFEIYAGVKSSGMQLVYKQEEDVIADEKGYKCTFAPVEARYVKVLMTHNTANPSVHIADLAVYGEKVKKPAAAVEAVSADPDDLAYGKPVRANANGAFASFVTDGDPESYWIGESYPKFVDVDLEENYALDRIALTAPAFAGFTYAVYTSLDGVHFTKAGQAKTTVKRRNVTLDAGGVKARVIRVMCIATTRGAHGASALCQVKAYGKKTGGKVTPTRKKIELTTYDRWLKEHEGVDLRKLKDQNGVYDAKDTYTAADTVKALEGLIARVLGKKYISWFIFEIDRKGKEDFYEIENAEDGKILIRANCGVSAAAGLNFYLKYFCKVQVTQQTKNVQMPKKTPLLAEKIKTVSPYKVRYAYNYCTLSYTMPYFGYEKWQRELDYLMLSGVNLILDLTGTEALWVSYLQKLGYTADEAKDYVCGYCYKAWWLMGNLEGYGGPVADEWVLDTLEMARVNQRYMTVMGAMPALQTFVGAMPESFASIANAHLKRKGFSDVTPYMAPQGLWAGGFVRPNVLKTTYDGYSYLAQTFYRTQNEIYGRATHFYCGDVCHEGGIVPADLSKPQMSAKILNELLASDKKAVWMLQGWWSNPMKEVLDGFGKLKKDHVMILDLAALANPKWTDTKTWDGIEFGGTPWIFCSLDNYGGRTGMHGKLQKTGELMTEARKTGKVMAGIGITPEGTNANPVVFDLFWEMGWRKEAPELRLWLAEYITRRYGRLTVNNREAWKLFARTVYEADTYDGTTKNNVINENACLGMGYCQGGYYKIKYSREDFEKGVALFMKDLPDFSDNAGYVYDAVDFLRMTLTIACDDYFEVLKRARVAKDAGRFEHYAAKYLKAMRLIAELSTYNEDEMMGNWIGRGYDFAADKRTGKYAQFDLDMMRYNGRILLTTWASSPITNYANRQFDGLMEDYFVRMWKELFKNVEEALEKGKEAPERLGERCFEIGWEFAVSEKEYRRDKAKPEGGADRGLAAIWKDVKKHVGNEDEIKTEIRALDKKLEKIRQKESKAEVSSTIATNIEH